MSEIVIRRAQVTDLPAIILLDWMSFSLPWPVRAFTREISEERTRMWVAEMVLDAPLEYRSPVENGVAAFTRLPGERAVVGMIVVWIIVDEAHIATLSVHPSLRQRGIARHMLRSVLRDATHEGCESALLEVRAGNIAAQKLYESFGFEVVGRRTHYYQDNQEDALLMTLARINIEEEA